MATELVLWAVSIFLGLLYAANGDKVAQKIYEPISGVNPCVLLTNATHQIGCTSSMSGHVGILHYIKSKADVDWIIQNGSHAPYVPLFRSDLFTLEMVDRLIQKKKINGALVIAVPSGKYRYTPQTDSPDYECPKDNFGIYSESTKYKNCKAVKWNPHGTRMSFKYFDIPMFALNDEAEVDYLLKCYKKHNKQEHPDYPLCAVELKDFMYAAKDTPTCVRKSNIPNPIGANFCLPLGDMNVWGTLYPIKKGKKVVMLATKLDSNSFFHDLVPGVDNDGSGIVVALAAAKALGALKRNGSLPETKYHIMFTFFQGEAWDYIGSSRMVYDMDKNEFPPDPWKVDGEKLTLNTGDIKYFLELNQLGLSNGKLWAHSDPLSTKHNETNKKVSKIVEALKSAGEKHDLEIGEPIDKPLPPSSFQMFLKKNSSIPGIVLTDHEGSYSNKFYNSHFDDLYQVGGNVSKDNDTVYLITEFTKKLSNISSAVATALYTLANDGTAPDFDIKADEALVGHLIFCLFNRSDCPLYREVTDSNKTWTKFQKTSASLKPFPRYVSVNTSTNALTITVEHLLLYFTGYHFPLGKDKDCKTSDGVVAVKVLGQKLQGVCVTGSVFLSPALSPAFVLEKYDSIEYSTWAESTWNNDLSVQVFLVASPTLEGVTLGAGLTITLLSFALVYFINKKADVIFTPADPLSSDLND
ncbi:Nicastrin [Stylophora pistillata]|uniref:Nicastrin n=1 Tax=Stylophora pistillata TaxID=50429 RepID=A0A2B4SCI2_STYPI|nr:Nicastrin [Stylophora pistillata]